MNNDNIRFEGNDNQWSSTSLGSICSRVIDRNSDFSIKETFTNSAQHGIISQLDFFNHDVTNMEKINNYIIVKENDFVYNPRISSLAPVGPINRNKLGRIGVVSPLYTVFRPNSIDYSYLEYFFKSNVWHKYMYYNGDTGARSDRFSIKDNIFYDMPIPIPNDTEQKKIGKFLTELDETLSYNKNKLDKLNKVRHSITDKMFVRDKSKKKPAIRFKNFDDEWKVKKFEDIFDFERPDNYMLQGSPDKSYGTPVLTANKAFILGYTNENNSYNKGNCVIFDDFTLDCKYVDFNFMINSSVIKILTTKNNNDLKFSYYLLKNANILMQGHARHYISVVQPSEIYVPNNDEANNIKLFLTKLDEIIELYQKRIDIIEKTKRTIINKMYA